MKNLFILFMCFLSFNAAKAQCWQSVSGLDQGQILAVKTDGTLWGWAGDFWHQLGDNDTAYKFRVIQTGNGTNDWASVSVADAHTYALKKNGTIWSTGRNTSGSLGLGPNHFEVNTFTQIGTDSDWTFIEGGWDCALALKKDSTLWGWGTNSSGRLSIPLIRISADTPVQLPGIKWKAVSIIARTGLGIRADGSLWGWGYNDAGQVGDGTNGPDRPMQQIGSDKDWASCYAFGGNCLAIKNDGTLYAWGGLLAGLTSVNANYFTPVQVTSMKWKTISAGGSMGITTDGKLWVWGRNDAYQWGDSTMDYQTHPVPKQVGTDTNWVFPFTTTYGCFAINSNNELYRWGRNIWGEMGAGRDTFDLRVPTKLKSTCDTTSTTAISNITNPDQLNIYPNPTEGILYINMPGREVMLTNSIGQSWKRNVNNNSVDIRDLADGVYYLRMPGSVSKTIIKQSK